MATDHSTAATTMVDLPPELVTMIGYNVPMLASSYGRGKRISTLTTTAADGDGPQQKKQQARLGNGGSSSHRWELTSFEHPARKDNLHLRHWSRKPATDTTTEQSDPATEASQFAKYDTSTNVYEYSDQEYKAVIQNSDASGNWTRAETDHLFSLCREYDLRWFVIKDRWHWSPSSEPQPAPSAAQAPSAADVAGSQAFPTTTEGSANGNSAMETDVPPKPQSEAAQTAAPAPVAPVVTAPYVERTLEDLKDRYFSICRKLIRIRPVADEAARQTLLHSYVFEKDREAARKAHVANVLFKLTPAQLAEEEFLYIESRRLEQTYMQTLREREDTWRLLSGAGPAVVPINTAAGGTHLAGAVLINGPATSSDANAAGNKKRRRGELDMLEEQKSTVAAGVPSLSAEQDAELCITRYDSSTPASSVMRPTGVYLRSGKPPQLKTSLAQRIQAVMQEQRIAMRLAMPTKTNMEKLDSFVTAITALLDCKKQVERAEYELKILKTRKEAAMRVEEEDRLQAKLEEEQNKKAS